jgi:hypothetical protein
MQPATVQHGSNGLGAIGVGCLRALGALGFRSFWAPNVEMTTL